MDTGCRLKDLPGAMDDRGELGERGSGKSVLVARLGDDMILSNYAYISVVICVDFVIWFKVIVFDTNNLREVVRFQ